MPRRSKCWLTLGNKGRRAARRCVRGDREVSHESMRVGVQQQELPFNVEEFTETVGTGD
jgi:hypothetical protein